MHDFARDRPDEGRLCCRRWRWFSQRRAGRHNGTRGILVTIWCGLRGWPKDVQRTIFQPLAATIFLMSALWIGAKEAVTADTAKLFLIGLPALFAGTWLGLKLFGRINEATFRKVVLLLLLVSGAVLIF